MDIVHSIDIETTPDRLYEAITKKAWLAGWWTPESNAEPKVGALNEFRFGPETTLMFRVAELEPARHVAWSSVQGPPDWKGTHVTFDITPKGDAVNLRFSHTGFAADYELFATFNYLWAQNIRSLKLFLETGTGEPFGSTASKAAKPSRLNLETGKGAPAMDVDLASVFETRTRPRAVTDGDTVLATVDVAASPERVLHALTTDEVEHWWGSADTYRMVDWAADLRVGGKWRVDVRAADGTIFPASGEFVAIDASHKIVQTRKYDWDHPLLGRRETTVTYRCDPIAADTRLTVRHDGFAGLRAPADEHAAGWERVLGLLEAYMRPVGASAAA